jgi:predicted permease
MQLFSIVGLGFVLSYCSSISFQFFFPSTLFFCFIATNRIVTDHRREKNMLKNLTNHEFFRPYVSKFFAYLQENVIIFLEKNYVKNATNHNFFGPWANELHAHLPKKKKN